MTRYVFYRYRTIILALSRAVGVLPKPMLRAGLGMIQPFGGVFFVLLRYLLLRNICAKFGDNVYVDNHVELRFPERLMVGSNVSINRQCYIDAMGGIEIGNDVSIAHQSSLIAFEHGYSDLSLPIRKNPLVPSPIRIADDVWIGAGVRVLAGAAIENRCIVAAGSVVTPRTEAVSGYLIAGVPAKPKKPLPFGGTRTRETEHAA